MDGRPNRRNKAEFSNSFSGVLTGPAFVDVTKQSVFSSVIIIINSAIITITRALVKPTVAGRHCFSFFKFFFFFTKSEFEHSHRKIRRKISCSRFRNCLLS